MSAAPRKGKKTARTVIAAEWNELAYSRQEQLAEHKDESYEKVLSPQIIAFLSREQHVTRVLDAGCGLGFLSNRLARRYEHVVGIDLSSVSVSLAKERLQRTKNVSFVVSSIQGYARGRAECFDAVVANMVLQTEPSLASFFQAAHRLLVPDGVLALTVPHPCFWPRYWGYEESRWFKYSKEEAVVAPFRVTGQAKSSGVSTHFHRPLSNYLNALRKSGFSLIEVAEPTPPTSASASYLKAWTFPRFLGLKVRKTEA